MKIYRFRVLYEDQEENDIYRDIEIQPKQTFEEFHKAIQSAYKFDGSQLASFFTCDKDWNKEKEIMLLDMGEETPEPPILMNQVKLESLIDKDRKKLIYIYDFLLCITFYVELTDIVDIKEKNVKFPRCIKTTGKLPSKVFDKLMRNAFNEDEDDDIGFGGDDDDLYSEDDMFEGSEDFYPEGSDNED